MSQVLGSQRELFEIPEDLAYLNVSYMSPLLRSVRRVGEESVARKSTPWLLGSEIFFKEAEVARSLFAELVGASANDIAVIASASYGVSTAARNIKLQEGDEVLVQAEEFPSIYYPLKRLCDERGARLVTVERPKEGGWTEAIVRSIRGRTKVVAVSPSHWTDGSSVDCGVLGHAVRKAGAVYIVDGCQSVGAVPIDIKEVEPDFLVVPTYKWLLGPYSCCFLYVSPRFQNGKPLDEVWCSRMGAEDLSNLVNYQEDYQPGARRFDVGERSNFILLPMVIEAMKRILDWGPKNISRTLEEATDEIADFAKGRGLLVLEKENRSPHMLGLRSKSGFSNEIRNRFQERKNHVSFRGSSMRISPHLHVSRRDLDAILSELRI